MFAFFGVLERGGFAMWVLFSVLACSGLGGEMGKGCIFCFFFPGFQTWTDYRFLWGHQPATSGILLK